MRTIAATFEDRRAALGARGTLTSSGRAWTVRVAPAMVSESDDEPIDLPRTIVAVTTDGDAGIARRMLLGAGGRLVADVELEGEAAARG